MLGNYEKCSKEEVSFSWLCFIVCGAFLLRYYSLSEFYFHPDELMHTLITKGHSIFDVYKRSLVELHPPLYYLLAYLPFKYTNSLMAFRWVSLVPSLATVIVFYIIGFRLRGNILGIIFSLLFAFSPISVVVSGLLRHYAFEMLFLSSSIYCLLVNWQDFRFKKIPAYYVALMSCACATNFSSFMPALVISLIVLIFYISNNQWSKVLKWMFSNCIFILLAVLFYFSHFSEGKMGKGWNDSIKNPAEFNETFSVSDFGILVNHTFNFMYHFFLPNIPLVFCVWAIFCFGLIKLMEEEKNISRIVYGVISFHLVLAYFSIYPMAGLRYCYFLLPFWGLPIAFGILGVYEKLNRVLPLLSKATPIYVFILCFMFLSLAGTRFYFEESQEYTLPISSYTEGMSFLSENISADDIVLTNRLSQLYFLYEQDQGSTMYFSSPISSIPFNGTQIFFANLHYNWSYLSEKYFYDFLLNVKPKIAEKHPKKVWFFIFSHRDYVISSLRDCEQIKNQISDLKELDGFLVFSIEGEYFNNYLASDFNILHGCLSRSREIVIPRALFKPASK